jgi:hypothetical protein
MKSPKETTADRKAHGKWYDDACGAAFGMELIGERWSLPVVRELMMVGGVSVTFAPVSPRSAPKC